ncbi:unnamed protein product [Prunus armeniaca]|uniref:Uncharacterized protein n=1 Tax=Prunus armeniaca TaxID=36596 RepID=A0A6J5U3F0_PRUAR|nr:unnamed protein product [Prunus armeniaca]
MPCDWLKLEKRLGERTVGKRGGGAGEGNSYVLIFGFLMFSVMDGLSLYNESLSLRDGRV